ncbi:MAG: hypothetical protein L0H64_12025, partial [Pseudonocardia sp.]|nr:hypothetical protein [Pseudonocardia sp.]
MTGVVAAENSLIYGGPVLVALHGLAVLGPLTLGLAVRGLAALVHDPRWRGLRFVGVACVVLFTAMVLSSGRHYYPVSLYPVLCRDRGGGVAGPTAGHPADRGPGRR